MLLDFLWSACTSMYNCQVDDDILSYNCAANEVIMQHSNTFLNSSCAQFSHCLME